MVRQGPSFADAVTAVASGQEQQMATVPHMLALRPRVAHERNKFGVTLLTAALYHGAPAYVVAAVLQANPVAARALTRGECDTALHIAAGWAQQPVVAMVYDAYPAALWAKNTEQLLPIDKATLMGRMGTCAFLRSLMKALNLSIPPFSQPTDMG